ncbi:MAG: hypothetical protein GX066_02210 [Clostridiaceae bacterium]|nr:hypothetical protein [Clostridiaceae bacterium]
MDISVETTMNYLKAGEIIFVFVSVTNRSGRSVHAMAIVALFDRDNKMMGLAYMSKTIDVGVTEQLNAGLRLPEDVTDHVLRVFVWEGKSLENTTMYPLSDVFELSPEPKRE